MDIVGTGKRVRIYVGEHDRAPGRHQPLWETILDFLRKEGASGATMVRGVAGFGAHSKLHLARLADIAPDLPVVVEWIDGPERVQRLLPRVCELVLTGTITLEDVDIVKYTHREPRPLPPDRVADVMTRQTVTVQQDTPLGEVASLLLDGDFRAVPVVDEEQHLQGVITNRDIAERDGLTAADVMTRDPVRVRPDEPLERAARLMASRRMKRLPVVDSEGRLLGIVSRVDVLRTMGEDYHAPVIEESLETLTPARVIGDIMRRDVPRVRADAHLGEVLDAVTSTRLNRAVVVDSDARVLGIVTDSDLLARLDRGRLAGESSLSANDVMHVRPLTLTADTLLTEAAQRMLEARRRVLPVTDQQGHLLGVADRADLLRAMRSSSSSSSL